MSRSSRPLVSVVIPNYNHAKFLRDRIESVLRQTFQDFEMILLDDASTDESRQVLERYATRDDTSLIVNEHNSGGPFGQWNLGVKNARGKYVWIAESDDDAEPNFLSELIPFLESDERIGIAAANSERIDATGEKLGIVTHDAFSDGALRWESDFRTDGITELSRRLYLQNTLPSASAIVFRRSIYEAAGPADATFRLSGDWWQWAKMLAHSDLAHRAAVLSRTRIHETNQRTLGTSRGTLELESLRVQRFIRTLTTVDPVLIRRGAERIATSWLQHLQAGRYAGSSRQHLAIARELLRADPRTAAWFASRLPDRLAVWTLRRLRARASS